MSRAGEPILWLAELVSETAWTARHESDLSPSERGRLQRIARPQRRMQFVAAHVLARRLIAGASATAVAEVALDVRADGRPVVAAPRGWQISLTHSRGWVAALAQQGASPIGIDIEAIDDRRDIEALVEAASGRRPQGREQAYWLWAGVEARLKAGGGAPHRAACFHASWRGLAIAACTAEPPRAELADLRDRAVAQPVELAWHAEVPSAEFSDAG